MINYEDDAIVVDMKNRLSDIKLSLNFLTVTFLLLGFAFCVFGAAASAAIAMVIGNVFFGLSVAGLVTYCLGDRVVEKLIAKHNEKIIEQNRIKRQQAYLECLKNQSELRSYAICISLDYKAQRVLDTDKKRVLNKMVYTRMQNAFGKVLHEVDIVSFDNVMVIVSNNFHSYDDVYGYVLDTLSKIKKEVDDKYALELIVSTTTDAYRMNEDKSIIIKNHFSIQKCDFKNRACSTAKFAKRYKSFNKNKYIGIPIGEYAVIDEDQVNSYELNIVYKDLSETLASL